jgi:hypothetical protein
LKRKSRLRLHSGWLLSLNHERRRHCRRIIKVCNSPPPSLEGDRLLSIGHQPLLQVEDVVILVVDGGLVSSLGVNLDNLEPSVGLSFHVRSRDRSIVNNCRGHD